MNRIRIRLRQPRTQATLVLILSIFVGIGTYLYILSYQERLSGANQLVPVYVAKGEIASGTSYSEINNQKLLELKEFPKGSIPNGALTPDVNLDPNFKTRGVLASGQILISNYFSAETTPDVGIVIPKGMLAVTVSIDDVSRVGNFVSPGSRVVVFTTSANNSGASVTKILLPEALVIGVGTETIKNAVSGMPTPSPLVTVALIPSDAQRLILASKTSEITLALAYENDPFTLVGSGIATTPLVDSGS